MRSYGVLFLEIHVENYSDFRSEQFKIGVLFDPTQLKDDVRDQRETQSRKHRVSYGVLAKVLR